MRKRIIRKIKRLLGKKPQRKTIYISFENWQYLTLSQAWYPDTTMEQRADMTLGKGLDLIKSVDPDQWGSE